MRLLSCLIGGVLFCAGISMARAQTGEDPAPSPEEFARGANLFAHTCSHCHGPEMVNPGNFSFDLRKFPRDGRDRFFNSVRNGKKAMPPWKDVLHPDEIEAIWAYVRTGGVAPQ